MAPGHVWLGTFCCCLFGGRVSLHSPDCPGIHRGPLLPLHLCLQDMFLKPLSSFGEQKGFPYEVAFRLGPKERRHKPVERLECRAECCPGSNAGCPGKQQAGWREAARGEPGAKNGILTAGRIRAIGVIITVVYDKIVL